MPDSRETGEARDSARDILARTDTPKRIQRKRIKGWRKPENAIIVTRGTRYGNPYRASEYGATAALDLYRRYLAAQLNTDPDFLTPLRGKDLACYCNLDAPCHADILLELANAEGVL